MENKKFNLKNFLAQYAIVLVLIALVVFFSLRAPQFLKSTNIFNILRQVAINGIITVGMTMVLLTGGIDLSVGSIVGLSCALTANLLLSNVPPVFAVLITLAVGVLVGLINGFFINAFNIPPLITTLAMQTAIRGVAYIITGGLPVFGFDQAITVIGKGYLGPIPIPVIIMAIVFVIGIIFLEKTRYGRYIYGVGGNEEASRLSGVNVKNIKYMVYAICGMLAALAGIVLLARVNSGQPKAGEKYEMDAITSAVLGGVSIAGGEGKLGFVVIGVLLMGVLSNGMIQLNVQEYVQWVVQGGTLVLAVGFDRFLRTRKKA